MISRILNRFPKIRGRLRRYKQYTRYSLIRSRLVDCRLGKGVTISTPWEWAGTEVESGDLFFGYYDKTPWSPDGERMVLHHLNRSKDSEVSIKIFDRAKKTCRNAAVTRAWNWQQGAMAQWLPGSGGEKIIFNDVVDRELVSRIVTAEGDEVAVIPFPIQTIHPNGREALSLNYRRLWRLRPDYGYTAEVRNLAPDAAPDRDGIWRIDLEAGTYGLMASLSYLSEFAPRARIDPIRSKVNHLIMSPSGEQCVFLYRWFDADGKHSRLFVMDRGGNCRLVYNNQFVSHYNWLNDQQLIVFGRMQQGGEGYFLLDSDDGGVKSFAAGEMDRYGDGHPSYSPDRRRLITDTYPNLDFEQKLLLFDNTNGMIHEAGSFLHSPHYHGSGRCDLHPRWSPDGKRISFDSVFSGYRSSYILDVSSLC